MEVIEHLLSFQMIIVLMVGVIGGIVVGALPGLSATMAVALLIPVTFGMDAVAGVTMLVAIYTAGVYGGSVSAILIHTPGTPASAATALDGYQMTKKGEGAKAIGIATISSMIGGAISAVVLLFLAPPLSRVSLAFSAPEYFLIAVFGLTIIGSLASQSMIKGLMSGVFGLIIGCIGVDGLSATPRFTFGIINLESGISMVPAMIGLFSLSQVLILSEKNKSQEGSASIKGLTGRVMPGFKEFKNMVPNIFRSTGIGTFVGALPGAGGDIASWVSYNEAKRFSKNPDEFGKGNPQGVAASEAANNAVTGGALIPLFTLGIPGSTTTAVLLGGLMIHGLSPGYQLFTENADITYAVIYGLIVANILMGIIGLLGAKYFVKISRLSHQILIPSIVVLCIVGSFAIKNSIFDVWVMLLFGIIGYFMRKTGFHPAPLILAFILGPMAERTLRQTITMSQGDFLGFFFTRPIALVLVALIILSLLAPMFINWWKRKSLKHVTND
ncbi:tripartite tricarboxylate transporter permease [Halalkalibacter oceani]|uniref:tripartite tricarboxylate transporter permease n=1 Tax=Halalkalibacter oceani TaxID=1653776 RepID=UPI003392E0C0